MPARGAPGLVEAYNTIEKLWPLARAISRATDTSATSNRARWANKHRAEQHAGFDGNRGDPFDGLLASRARR